MMKVNYKAIADIKPLVPQFDIEEAKERLDRVSANEHYELGKTLSESDAEAMIISLVEKYPGIVMKILSQKYIKNLATLEAMSSFMEERGI